MAATQMVAVDTRVWVTRLARQDVFHRPACDWIAARWVENTLHIHSAVSSRNQTGMSLRVNPQRSAHFILEETGNQVS